MKNLINLLLLFSVLTANSLFAQEGGGSFWQPKSPLHFEYDDTPWSFVEPPAGLSESSNETFSLTKLVGTSINGMLDSSCGGYCIVGFCAHLKLGFSLTRGPYYYTIISPRLNHALPELLVSSYDDIGEEPLKEWRDTFGRVIKTANSNSGNLLGIPDGLQGGRPDPLQQGYHQTVSFKEVDIIGHPLAMLPDLINEGSSPSLSDYQVPDYGRVSNNSPARLDNQTQSSLERVGLSFNPDKIKVPSLTDVTGEIKNKAEDAIRSINITEQIESIRETAQTIKNIKKTVNTALDAAQLAVQGSGWGNFTRPRFRAPRLFCPTSIKPMQPYYMSFLDSFWWRSGYPLTDGPISGTDKSSTIINPLSTDTLQKVSSASEILTKEIWGNLYPRDGSINQSHDAKTASVLAWRGMDVLHTAVRTGHRVGVPLVNNSPGKWQMIFPQVKSCRDDPYYPQGSDLSIDSLKPSNYGGYAWNYYRTYNCCSNTSGHKIGSVNLPKICLSLDDVLAGIEEDRADYERWLEQQEAN